MRDVVLVSVLALVGCGTAAPEVGPTAPPVPVTSPVTIAAQPRSCTDAAFGIDRTTKDLHPPEYEVVPVLRVRCKEDAWSRAVIECFDALTSEDGVERCIGLLPEAQRAPVLSDIRGAQADQAAELADVTAKLTALAVGIASCDSFVQAVTRMMTCEALDAEARIQLGTETAEAWSLPMARLSVQDKAKLAAACHQSLSSLQHHATDLACALRDGG